VAYTVSMFSESSGVVDPCFSETEKFRVVRLDEVRETIREKIR